ncbi:MAG: LacI family DNA-binding transcriptional regulator [Solobacterium sp.]|nr:LacI family DNA-binding transcriptional regulator [Solobacterium sp.]
MDKKVTIQDIADALDLSRNTVSKAINNSEGIAESTKEMILNKAVEMGYKQFSYVKDFLLTSGGSDVNRDTADSGPKEIALLTAGAVNNSHFASLMLDNFTHEIQQLGFSLVTYRISAQNLEQQTLPRAFMKDNTRAVMCIEVFDRTYSDMICSLGLPTLFIDCAPMEKGKTVNADLLLMDNIAGIMEFISVMAAKGVRRFGFIGDYTHCQSFYERYLAFRAGLLNEGLEAEKRFIIAPQGGNVDDMADRLEHLQELPEVFICANDFVAIDAMLILRSIGVRIPEDVRFLGFDDSPESRAFDPVLSTVRIHTQDMAFSAVQLLISRIKEPNMETRTVHVASDLILRKSSEI